MSVAEPCEMSTYLVLTDTDSDTAGSTKQNRKQAERLECDMDPEPLEQSEEQVASWEQDHEAANHKQSMHVTARSTNITLLFHA